MVSTEQKVFELDKALQVHLMECTGRHEAIKLKLDDLGKKLVEYVDEGREFREAQQKLQMRIFYIAVTGFVGLLLAVLLGPDQGLKILTSVLKSGG